MTDKNKDEQLGGWLRPRMIPIIAALILISIVIGAGLYSC